MYMILYIYTEYDKLQISTFCSAWTYLQLFEFKVRSSQLNLQVMHSALPHGHFRPQALGFLWFIDVYICGDDLI